MIDPDVLRISEYIGLSMSLNYEMLLFADFARFFFVLLDFHSTHSARSIRAVYGKIRVRLLSIAWCMLYINRFDDVEAAKYNYICEYVMCTRAPPPRTPALLYHIKPKTVQHGIPCVFIPLLDVLFRSCYVFSFRKRNYNCR